MENPPHRWMLFLCITMLLVIAACDDPPEQKPGKPTSAVSHTMPPMPRDEKSLPGKTDNRQDSLQLKKPVTEIQVKQDQAEVEQGPAEVAEDVLETGNKNSTGEDAGYVATSKLDPFMPLIREQKETVVPKIEKSDKPRRILTPLEKMDLSQIKLVAVVIAGTRKIAMVEEATGKGYEVKIGTYMGKNEGQVVDITFESIVVKENITDFKGNQTERFHEIKLHKTDNGE